MTLGRDYCGGQGLATVRTAEDLQRALREPQSPAKPGAREPRRPLPLLVRRDGHDFWTALPRR